MEEEEEYLKVNAAQRQTVPAGLQCAVDGDTVRPLTSLTEILMLASVPLLQIVLGGLRLVLSGATVRRLVLVKVVLEVVVEVREVVEVVEVVVEVMEVVVEVMEVVEVVELVVV